MREGWQRNSLGSLLKAGVLDGIQDGNHGNDHPKSYEYTSEGIPFVMSRDLSGGRINTNTCAYLPRSRADRLRIGFAKAGDILLSHKGTVGAVARVQEGFPYVMLTPQVTYYRVRDKTQLAPDFLEQVFLSPEFQSRIQKISAQSTRAYVGITEQKRLEIPVPPFAEQRKIAAILRTWDEALEKLNALRAAKARRMAGVAQALLDASRAIGRDIPPSNWNLGSFGELFEERQDRNYGLTADDVVTVGKYAIRKQSEHFTRSVASKDLSNYWTISPGDFVYDPMSAYYGAIGRYLASSDGIVSPAYRVMRLNNDHDPDFVAALLKAHHIRFLLETRSSQGNKEGKRRLLQRDEFQSIEFRLPSKEVQSEIARKLSVFQADLDLTDAEIEALTDQKRGLMQKLLTGEWPVEVSDDEEAAA